PAGTLPVAALALRGADPSVSFAAADSFNTTLGATLCVIPGAAGQVEAAYSNVAGELVGALFTSDPAVLDTATILAVIDPAKMRVAWLRLLADGLDDAVSLTSKRFRYERDSILSGLDYAALAAGYLVTAADMFPTEVPAGAVGGAGTLWIRSTTIRSFATPVRGQPGLFSLAPLADLYRLTPGIFCTADRDLPGCTFRLVLEESQRRAQDARMPYASVASSSPMNTARAAAQAFVATTPPGRDWELLGPNGTLGDLDRRALDWADRCCMAGGAAQIGAGGGRAFLEVVCRRFDELRLALPSLHVVLDGLLSSQAITNELAALATGCFKPARGLPESIQDLVAIEDACLKLIFPMEEHNLLTATQRVAWICSMMQDAHARGGGGGGGGASSGSGEPSDPGTMTLIRAALSTPAARVFFTELRALLDAAPPNSLTISRKLTSSPIAFIKRMGTGVAPPASYTSTLWRDEFDRASLHVLKDKWRYNLSMRLAADKSGKVRQTAEKWRIDALTAAAIVDYRFDEIDWFGLIYDVRGVQGDTDFMRAPAEIHFSEIDHFTSLEMVVKRIENALSLDSAATNSLSSGVDKAHEYFKDNCNSELTRTDDIDIIQTFFKEMWSSVREEWYPVILPSLPSLDPIFDASERDEIDEALGVGGLYEVGKRAAMPPLPGPSQGFEREPRSFEEMWAVHRSEVAELREVFSTPGPILTATEADRLAGPLATGFGDASGASGLPCAPRALAVGFDAIWAADCPAWHARVGEADPEQIPLALREAGALASFTDDALAMAPFATRCRPPVTTGRPPPAGQRSGPPGPRSYEGFYPPGHFRSKADPWLLAQHAYLLDALEHGEACTVKPPKALLFSDNERLPEFRGRLYEYSTARDEYVLTDTSAPATTHLNLQFAAQFSGDYPDRELFSTLEFGVDFDADNLEMQVVLPPHLLSLAGGLSK
ncbi:hypothetical protein Ctob_016543, partial [Chrysochromulina tobinii]